MAEAADARPAARRKLRPPVAVALVALGLLAGGLGLDEAATDAPTIDEPVYVSAGLASLTRHDLRLNTQHPPLAKAIAALPVLLAGPPSPSGRAWAHARERPYAAAFQQASRRMGTLHTITLLSRLLPLLGTLASGLVVFLLGRRLGGDRGGLLAAGLWLLNPYVLGIGHVDGIDMPAALATLVVVLAVARWAERPSPRRLVVLGLACAAAVLVRDTGLLAALVALAIVAWRARAARPVLAVLAVWAASIWLVYLALDPAFTLAYPNVLPQRYVDGLRALAAAHARPAPAFLLGHVWNGGRWWFWPASMAIKLPASMLLAFALAMVALVRRRRELDAPLLLAVAGCGIVLTVFTVVAPVDFGLRYLLGPIALACVATAALARLPPGLLALVVAIGAAFTLASAPASIAWTAPPFGPTYDITAAGNGDWGQDAWRLQSWARGRHAWIACYEPRGSGCVQDVAGARRLTKHQTPGTVHGWVAISATLRNLHGWDPWLAHERLAGTIGETVLLYHLP